MLNNKIYDSNTQAELTKQEMEFYKGFKEHMKIVDLGLDKLKSDISNTIHLEKKDQAFQRIINERDFFREHALFLDQQNKSQLKRFNRKIKK